MSNKKIFLILLLCNYVLIANDINDGNYIIKSLEGYSLNSFYKKKYPNSNGIIKIKNDNNGSKLYTYEEKEVLNFNDIENELSIDDISKNKEVDNYNIYKNLDNNYYFQHKLTGLFLTSFKEEKKIILKPWNSEDNQKWFFKKVDATPYLYHNYQFKTKIDNKTFFLDIEGDFSPGSYNSIFELETNVQINNWRVRLNNKSENNPDNYFSITLDEDNGFKIKPLNSRYYLDVNGGQTFNENKIQLYESNTTDSQIFEFIPDVIDDKLFYYLKTKLSDKDNSSEKFLSYKKEYKDVIIKKENNNNNIEYEHIYKNQIVINESKIAWELVPYVKYQMTKDMLEREFYIKSAFSNLYWDTVTGEGPEVVDNNFLMDFLKENPRVKKSKFKIIPASDGHWIYIGIVDNNGNISSYISKSNDSINIQNEKNESNKFAIEFTSPKTFVFRASKNEDKSIHISGEDLKKIKVASLQINQTNHEEAQQFQFIDVETDNPYFFKPINDVTQ